MNIEKWLKLNTFSLNGKTVAVTGSTGGIGRELCLYLARLGADLVLVDRNFERSSAFRDELTERYNARCKCVTCDLEDFKSVKVAVDNLKLQKIDIFIHNAGAYSIPRKTCETGFDNVFQINFVSPYYIIKQLKQTLSRVVVVGSIAHNYSKLDVNDIDFKTRKQSSLVYGNAKRFLMFSLYELYKNQIGLAVTHPGITFTNITAHYPKLVFSVIKHPMKVIFMKPRKAALSILNGCFQNTEYHFWIGPSIFNVWGYPKKQKLKTCTNLESQKIGEIAEEIYKKLNASYKS